MLFPSSEVISDAKGKSIVILADPMPYAQVNVLVAITNRWLNDHAFFVEWDSQVCKWRIGLQTLAYGEILIQQTLFNTILYTMHVYRLIG